MRSVAPEAVLSQLQWRCAVKKFDATRKIPADLWTRLEEAVVLSPSSYGLQPWKFFVVTDPVVRARLQPAAFGQPQIVDASHLVVFTVKKGMCPDDAARLVARAAEVRGVPVESLEEHKKRMAGSLGSRPPEQIDAWMTRQVYIALGVFLTSAALLGVDACPMEGFAPDKFDEILGLSQKGYGSVVLATAGYRSPEDVYSAAAKVRYPHKEMIEHI
ncbi:NAD(P)H-dependent oxidoreductase [Fimbriiglobus ruber]|uniref:Nitroreductase n=1 Tax=Fimbriiglobus ruber TaxID=1908690 RepID=A0A225EFQ0_9BACT|nr:NAD(P)H-dependent oxidoreductase [Fimbriiglobus ruber]OWK47175.1 nitroreductase [Fimbriiglobus ruber]